jgi:hypothetical protein
MNTAGIQAMAHTSTASGIAGYVRSWFTMASFGSEEGVLMKWAGIPTSQVEHI